MKPRLLFAFLILSSVSHAQSRNQLKNQIQAYKDSVVLTATYPISTDSLLGLIETYYVSEGWERQEESQRFSKVVKTRNRRDEPRAVKRSGVSRVSRFVTCSTRSLVEVETQEAGGFADFTARAFIDQNHVNRGWDCPSRPTYYRPELDELSLRRYLYMEVFGEWLELRSDLEQSIVKFNGSQQSDKRLLIAGIDY